MKEHGDGTRKVAANQTVNDMKILTWSMILPILAVLNIADASVSYFLFKQFGSEIEGNPLISELLRFDSSQELFLIVKLVLSGLIVAYWCKADGVPRSITTLTFLGIIVYTGMFLHGVYTIISI